jgi:hypothetical protein
MLDDIVFNNLSIQKKNKLDIIMTVNIYDSCDARPVSSQRTWRTEHPEDKSSLNSCLTIASVSYFFSPWLPMSFPNSFCLNRSCVTYFILSVNTPCCFLTHNSLKAWLPITCSKVVCYP